MGSLSGDLGFSQCTNPNRAIDGFVATNSQWYVSGPPSFNTSTGTLDYTVLSPHFRPEGTPFKGTYDLLIDREVADCIYGLNPANPVTGQISLEYPNSEKAPTAASISEVDGWVRLSVSGFTFSSPTVKADLNSVPATSVAQSFVPIDPTRIIDTRTGLGSPVARVGNGAAGGDPLVYKVAGQATVPASGVGAVSLNVTVSETNTPSHGGYVTVYPCGTRPDASNLNFMSGEVVPNAVIAPVASDGTICFYVYGQANLIVDINGYFNAGTGFTAVPPTRVADTRMGVGATQARVGDGSMNATPIEVQIAGLANVPTTGVSSVSLNLTATNTTTGEAGGYVTAYPCGTRPTTSSLNFISSKTVPNAVVVPVSSKGTVCLFVFGQADLLVDVNGWFAKTAGFTSMGPTRVLDTRTGEGTEFIGRPGGDYVLKLPLTGLHDLPQTGVGAVSLNVTVTSSDAPDEGGYVTVYPCGTAPEASNLNFKADQTVANAVIVPLSDTGRVCFRVYGQTHLIADINGWFPS